MNYRNLKTAIRRGSEALHDALRRVMKRVNRPVSIRAPDIRRWMTMDVDDVVRRLLALMRRDLIIGMPGNISLSGVEHWPPMFRRMVWLLSFIVISAVSAFMFWGDALQRLEALDHETSLLKARYAQFASANSTLPRYEQQVAQIEAQFGEMLEMIPASLEVVQVLDQITQASRESGLQLQSFKPAPEMPADAYVILPVDIRLSGSYHAVGRFLESVSRMKHLLTVDVLLEAAGTVPGQLILSARVKAYRAKPVRQTSNLTGVLENAGAMP